MKRPVTVLAAAVLAAVILAAPTARAEGEILKVRIMSSDLAAKIAQGAVHACREKGYQASAVVLDRAGNMIAAQRDTLASRHTLEIAERKAGLVVMSGADSGDIRKNRGDIRSDLNHMRGVIVMEGGVQIRVAGSLVGAVGVSGAPGGDIDADCARGGIDTVRDILDFAD
ncbi:MAG: hypothetical protein COW30_14565 [Rhodospirillales bacterium CG15_BIG_FIL_POST_REV_8_21_14_020_66_15]|nr:MAG: hypothetical protein COW30_14565 [Rhodospirillales bacterium CG15_BIG_FIL_POST_REV_8_21_14_020_66_15]